MGDMTALPAAHMFPSFTKPVISSSNNKALSIDDTSGNFFSGIFINFCNSCPGNVHLGGALFMGFSLKIYQTDNLIFIQSQCDSFWLLAIFRGKRFILGGATNSAASWGSWHIRHLLVFDICRL